MLFLCKCIFSEKIVKFHANENICLVMLNFRLHCLFGLQVQRDCAVVFGPHFTSDGLVNRCLEFAVSLDHIMDFTRLRALNSLFSMLNQCVRNILTYNSGHPDFPMAVSELFFYIN